MRVIILMAGLMTMRLCAQNTPVAAPKLPEIRAQVGMMGDTFQFLGGQLLGGEPVKGVPYSAEAVNQTTQTLADGSHIVNSSSSMIYRDSEGRERREESIGKLGSLSASGTPVKAVFISDPVAKVSYSLDAATHTAHKMVSMGGASASVAGVKPGTTVSINRGFRMAGGPGQDEPMVFFEARTIGGNDKAGKAENLGIQTMEGVQAEGTRTTVTIPAGEVGNERDINVVSERWYSQELKALIMSKHSDPRIGETVYKLTNINRAEPLHSMFEVPADYTIVEPPMIKARVTQGKEDQNQQ